MIFKINFSINNLSTVIRRNELPKFFQLWSSLLCKYFFIEVELCHVSLFYYDSQVGGTYCEMLRVPTGDFNQLKIVIRGLEILNYVLLYFVRCICWLMYWRVREPTLLYLFFIKCISENSLHLNYLNRKCACLSLRFACATTLCLFSLRYMRRLMLVFAAYPYVIVHYF